MVTSSVKARKLFYVIPALIALALIELASSAIFFGVRQKAFSYAEIQAERQAVVTAFEGMQSREFGALAVGDPPGSIYEVLHPYLGFVQDPRRTKGYSDYGFPDADVQPYTKDSKRIVIGIFGGSFAEGLSRTTKKVLTTALKRSPRFADKEIKILTIAMGGYKEPQQMLALAYLMSMGFHFDVVVNLDGLNEIALPVTDNIAKGVSPFYPRNWSARMNSFDATMMSFAREHTSLTENRRFLASLFSQLPLRYSVAANVVWLALDRTTGRKIQSVNLAAQKYHPQENTVSYMARGPFFSYAGDSDTYDDLAQMWMRSSVVMNALARANGMIYLHFLQPNQYVPGSKTMGNDERRLAYDENHPYRNSVLAGYPRLQQRGKDLQQQGVAFFDLTMSLSSHPEHLYGDTCCHLNQPGYELIALEIASRIVMQ
jgi:hypothetical protein